MSQRPSLFNKTAPAASEPKPVGERAKAALEMMEAAAIAPSAREAVSSPRYPKAPAREGKRLVTVYLAPEAFRQLKRLAADTDAQQQDLLVEGINLLFEKHGMSRIA